MSEPKIAFFDVENAPSLGWFYDPYKENNIVATEQPWFMLSFSWKHPGEKKIHDHALPDYPGYRRDKTNDKKLIEDLWKLFDSHDTLIGHNIGRFDCRKATSRFLNWGMKPPSPYVILDSLKEIRKLSYEDSNRLGSLSTKWGFGDKLPTQGWDTWRGCIEGNPADWRVLRRYGKVDCLRAEQVWGVVAPWKKNYGQATGRMCPSPTCGSLNINSRGPVRGGPKHQFVCLSCGHWWVAKPMGDGNGGRRTRI